MIENNKISNKASYYKAFYRHKITENKMKLYTNDKNGNKWK